ncbi:hypothetical protein PBY51_007111 [Eleginops maclovinus]|uniref:Uncharacterized protein n=1 Tax=Eleginops maclovinus TaxID=56733 RepID=A0AAN8AFJ1_ELEMC|nr:hypothetical protein PBY51_007111 [Eleginops maclovinus]
MFSLCFLYNSKSKPRVRMYSRVCIFLIGAVFLYSQIIGAEDVYVAELMVESNVTLTADTILSVLNGILSVDGHTVTLSTTLVAECLIIGDETNCSCSDGYIWSNPVCYNYNCCREVPCTKNVSDITPLCIAKVKVRINGSVSLNDIAPWDSGLTIQLKLKLEELNGFENMSVSHRSTADGKTVADFVADVSVIFKTQTLQDIVNEAQAQLGAVIVVDTVGMVNIESPRNKIFYNSTAEMKCTFTEKTESASWNIFGEQGFYQIKTGTVAKLETCTAEGYGSCVKMNLLNATGIWSGRYKCEFKKGSVRHTAKTELIVALLPDLITLKIKPLTVDCSGVGDNTTVTVTATILNSKEHFDFWWTYRKDDKYNSSKTSVGENVVYEFNASISCMKTTESDIINVTFKNSVAQTQTKKMDILVIYAGAKFCIAAVDEYGQSWPKTPEGNTVIIDNCTAGRVGYKSRTCTNTKWDDVFSYCVDAKLNEVLNAAGKFEQGQGATQAVAEDIFEGLKNSSLSDDSSDSTADVTASINVLNVMARATKFIVLEESILPDFVNAASNMLNKTWGGVNKSILHTISSTYLHSVEDLVKNIKVNNSNGLNSSNLELKFCPDPDCNMTVFGIAVSMNKTNGTMKTVAVKNLMGKLKNNIHDSVPDSILLSVTLSSNISKISLVFPQENPSSNRRMCVFWDTKNCEWSEKGCNVKTTNGNHTVCECEHLTSFATLMSKSDVSTEALDMITYVGLGVSVCSLLIFLIIEYLVWSAVVKSNLSHFRHTAIVNIAVFLLLANCSFLASISPKSLSDNWCLVLTICKHLFYLAMFNWMMCMSVMLVHQLIFVFSPLRKKVFMFFSSIVGYVFPILIVGSSYVYCKYTEKAYYERKSCWLVFEGTLEGSLHAFLLPVGTVILTNLFSMVVVILTLVKSNAPETSKTDDKETAKSILKVVVFLTPVFGLTWIIGFAQLMMDENSLPHTIAIYSFTILNSFQGLFILITGCVAEQKVREELIKLIMAKSKGKSESMKNLTSTTYSRDK